MTKKEIEKGAGLLLAAVSGCEQMVELLRAAVHYCYEQEKTAKNLTPKGYAGFTRIHHIWTAVSYTHLDVYKRQSVCHAHAQPRKRRL